MRALRSTLAISLMVASAAALAMPSFYTVFKQTFKVPEGSALAKANCAVCHSQVPKLNPFGVDIQKAMKELKTNKVTPEVLKKVENLDSDKDGVKNIDEIKKGTLPGDPKSK